MGERDRALDQDVSLVFDCNDLRNKINTKMFVVLFFFTKDKSIDVFKS